MRVVCMNLWSASTSELEQWRVCLLSVSMGNVLVWLSMSVSECKC